MLRVRVIPAVVPQEALPAAEAVEEAAEEVPPAEAADTAFKKILMDQYRAVCPVFLYSLGIIYSVK